MPPTLGGRSFTFAAPQEDCGNAGGRQAGGRELYVSMVNKDGDTNIFDFKKD